MKLEVKNLHKSFGETEVLHGISFSVESGRALGLLGRNGAGKTTTIRILMQVFGANEGTVLLDGVPFSPKKIGIGYLPEERGLYPKKTVTEQLMYLAALRGMKRTEAAKAVKHWLERMGVEDYASRKLETLSKGNQQKVQLAATLLHDPPVIILDEPTVGLDPKQIIEIRDLIKSLKEKHTVILSSHILSEVSAVCDYVLIISHGKLVASDTPENLGKLAEGSNTLNLIVKGEKDKICTALGQIEGVKNVTAADAKEEYAWNVTVSTNEDCDVREEVFFKMADAKCPILEMQSRKVSLEEIFLELTEDDKKSKTSDKKMEVNSAGEAEKILEAQNGETDKKEGENK